MVNKKSDAVFPLARDEPIGFPNKFQKNTANLLDIIRPLLSYSFENILSGGSMHPAHRTGTAAVLLGSLIGCTLLLSLLLIPRSSSSADGDAGWAL